MQVPNNNPRVISLSLSLLSIFLSHFLSVCLLDHILSALSDDTQAVCVCVCVSPSLSLSFSLSPSRSLVLFQNPTRSVESSRQLSMKKAKYL